MLEAIRDVRCSDLVQFNSHDEAFMVAPFGQKKLYKSIGCPTCGKVHLLDKSYTFIEEK